MRSVSAKEGNSVTLKTNVTDIQTDNVIQWRFKDALIAQFSRMTNNVSYDDADGRFTGRLEVNWAGSLIITKIQTDDSGLYKVNITSSKHIIHKRFRVTVTGE